MITICFYSYKNTRFSNLNLAPSVLLKVVFVIISGCFDSAMNNTFSYWRLPSVEYFE